MELMLHTNRRSPLHQLKKRGKSIPMIVMAILLFMPAWTLADIITVRNANGSYELSSGDTLVISGGITFTGSVDGDEQSDAAIKVESGATWNRANLNEFEGTFINYGTATFNSFNFEKDGQKFENFGIATFSSLNFNKDGAINNKSGATLNISNSFTLPGGASLTNDGYMTVNGDFNRNNSGDDDDEEINDEDEDDRTISNQFKSRNINTGNELTNGLVTSKVDDISGPITTLAAGTFVNNDWLQINSNFNNSGNSENQGLITIGGDFNNQNGGTYDNYCNLDITGNLNNSNGSTINNYGYLFIVGSGKALQNNSGATYNAVEYSHTQGQNFTNSGLVMGDGDLRFSGYTTNNSGGDMGNTGSDFRFFDTGFPSGGMDVNNGNTGSGVSFTYVPSYTSSDISQFCSNSFFASQVLPVEYAYFTGKMTTAGVELLWETIAEINNKEFVIERSVDGNLYESIDVISEQDGQQRSSLGGRKYTYMDTQATLFNSATIYYRLKQVDIDGAFTVSSILEVSIEDSDSQYWGRTYPNPASDKFTLETVVPVNYELISPQGQRVKAGIAKAGERNTIDISTLTPGVYILRIEENMQINYRRILIL